jgi:hypothetical protein
MLCDALKDTARKPVEGPLWGCPAQGVFYLYCYSANTPFDGTADTATEVAQWKQDNVPHGAARLAV